MTTMYRVASANLYDRTIGNIQRKQAELASQMEHVSAGKRVIRTSDDPVAAAQAERALNRITRISADQRTLKAQEATIRYAESTLREIYSAVQDFRTLLVQVGDGAYNQTQRATLVEQLTHLRQQIEGYVNRKDSNGLPLFRALDTHSTTPFPNAQRGVQSGQVNIGEYSIANALDGVRAFFSGQSGNGVLETAVDMPVQLNAAGSAGPVISKGEPDPAPATPDESYAYKDAKGDWVKVPKGQAMPVNAKDDDGFRRGWIEAGVVKNPDLAAQIGDKDKVTVTLVKDGLTGALNYYVVGEKDMAGNVSATPRRLVNEKTGAPLQYKSGQTIMVQGMEVAIHGENMQAGETFAITKSHQVSLFEVLDRTIADVNSGDRKHGHNSQDAITASGTNHGKLATDMARALSEIDIGLNRISTVTGTAGSMLQLVDKIEKTLDERNEQVTELRVNAQGYNDKEMVAAYSQLQQQQTAVSAALQSYASIQKLSLFDFIR